MRSLAVAPAWRNNKHRWLWVPDQRSLGSLVRDDVNFVPEAGSNFQTAETISDTTPHSRGARRPRDAWIVSPKENRGRRESRVLAAPAASRAKLNKAHERSHHRFRRIQPGLPRAMVLTAYFVLSPATRLYCHRRLRIWYVKTRLGLRTSTDLTPASGRQNHTTSPSAKSVCRLRAIRQLTGLTTRPAIP